MLYSPYSICLFQASVHCGSIYISAWASALLVSTGWAMREPQSVGRVTDENSHAFFVYTINHQYFVRIREFPDLLMNTTVIWKILEK